jgi:hypothetical protein
VSFVPELDTPANPKASDTDTQPDSDSLLYETNGDGNRDTQEEDLIQQVLDRTRKNFPYGNLFESKKKPTSIRVFYRTINGIRTYNSWLKCTQRM